jgi:hypothetical protein
MGFFNLGRKKITNQSLEIANNLIKKKGKFLKIFTDNSAVVNEYGKIFEIESTPSFTRLKIASDHEQIELLLKLCLNLTPPYFIHYVLVTSSLGNQLARYRSNEINSLKSVSEFLNEFKEFLEFDGRHHIWISNKDNSEILVYDQHNVIFSYGQLNNQLAILKAEGYKQTSFNFPYPHAHHFNPEFNILEEKILKYWPWVLFGLTPDDTQ